MDELKEDKLVQRMRRLLGEWLAREDWEPQQLIDWLQGYGLPPFGHDDDPFLWLLRGLPAGDERYSAETKLASRVAAVLEEQPDVKCPGDRPDELLYNLFMLCAGLGCPDQLSEPLYCVFERGQLKGEWLGVDLRGVLRDALISNPLDNRLQPVWEAMFKGRGHDFLPGDTYDGFEGIRLMPPSADKRGEPALDAIGNALKAMARYLEQAHDRRPEFRSLINRVVDTYPGRPPWDIDLVMQADKNRWPTWAVECLPSLYIPLGAQTDGHESALIWHYIVACIPGGYDYEVVKELCDGHILEVTMAAKTVKFGRFIVPMFEQERLGHPYLTDRSTIGVVNQTMIEIEVSLPDAKEAETTKKARKELLIKEKVIPRNV